jgi:hypothetical protein
MPMVTSAPGVLRLLDGCPEDAWKARTFVITWSAGSTTIVASGSCARRRAAA